MTRRNRNARKRAVPQPIEELMAPTTEQLAKGNIVPRYIVHVDTWTTAKAHKVSNQLDQWFDAGYTGFEEPARAAIEWCQTRWEARGVIGRQCANYSPTVGSGGNAVRDIELRDELDEVKDRFPAAYWCVFENVCRWAMPAGTAGSDQARNSPQAISAARAIVGLIANTIAMQKGF